MSKRILSFLALAPVALLGVTGCPADECDCIDEDGDGFCTASCAGTLADCDDDNAFVFPGAADHHEDGFDFDCNGHDLGGQGAPCNDDAQCTAVCNVAYGVCAQAPEDCRSPGDEDGNGLSDCSDPTCIDICMSQTQSLCGDFATPGMATQPPTTRLAQNECTGMDVATAYAIVPGQPGERGVLTMWTLGTSAFELRTQSCDTLGTCQRGYDGASPLTRPWEGGDPLWVVVPGAANHTFFWSFEVSVCGDGTQDRYEECDDGNTDNNDGCRSDCTLETDFNVCSVAEPLNLGITTVSSEGGTSVVDPSCAVFDGRVERAYALPVATGRIRIAYSAERSVVVAPQEFDCAELGHQCQEPASSGIFELDLDLDPARYLLVDGYVESLQFIIEVLD